MAASGFEQVLHFNLELADVVFAISGTKDNLGTVSVIPRDILEANLNSALVKLELDWSAIDRRYFCYMFDLNITRIQIEFIGKGAAQNNLNNEEISQIHIFLPSISEQEKIVRYLDEAHFKKKQKEEEAQRSLDSIDDYLLSELGINLPEAEESAIQSRVFTRQLYQVSGRRFDPDYYRNFHNKLELAVASTEFTIRTMKELTTLISNGNTPANDDYSDEETLYPIIKVGSYEDSFIALSKAGYTRTKKSKLARKDDIFLLSAAHQANYVGRFLKYLEDTPREYTSFVGELICIRAKQEICNPIYLYSLLNTALYKDLLNREKTGQTSHIYPKDIQRINIPTPPLAKQDEIADRITAIRTQAKQLRKAAAAELEQAKQEVEAMILGEPENEA
jgi:restriction endonuclease S subunit